MYKVNGLVLSGNKPLALIAITVDSVDCVTGPLWVLFTSKSFTSTSYINLFFLLQRWWFLQACHSHAFRNLRDGTACQDISHWPALSMDQVTGDQLIGAHPSASNVSSYWNNSTPHGIHASGMWFDPGWDSPEDTAASHQHRQRCTNEDCPPTTFTCCSEYPSTPCSRHQD